MKSEPFNPVQLHLLKMFSYAKGERALEEIRKSLTAYFAQRVEEDMDKLWDEGLWDQDKNEAILKEHLRVPYNDGYSIGCYLSDFIYFVKKLFNEYVERLRF